MFLEIITEQTHKIQFLNHSQEDACLRFGLIQLRKPLLNSQTSSKTWTSLSRGTN